MSKQLFVARGQQDAVEGKAATMAGTSWQAKAYMEGFSCAAAAKAVDDYVVPSSPILFKAPRAQRDSYRKMNAIVTKIKAKHNRLAIAAGPFKRNHVVMSSNIRRQDQSYERAHQLMPA